MNRSVSDPIDRHAPLRELTDRTLSPLGRYGHVLLLLGASAMAALLLALLLTEPSLPARTRWAFAALLLVAASWIAYAVWVLLQRRPLMHGHRVIAAYLACTFSGAFAIVAGIAAWMTGAAAAWAASGSGLAMLAVSVALLVRARERRRALLARLDTLTRTADPAG